MRTPLPAPCPACTGPVVYGGVGRRPVYCSPACHASAKVGRRRARRAAARTLPEVLSRERRHSATKSLAELMSHAAAEATLTALRQLDAQREATLDRAPHPDRPAWAADGQQYRDAGGDFVLDDWEARPRRPRDADHAARWLAQHHPDALYDFPAAFL